MKTGDNHTVASPPSPDLPLWAKPLQAHREPQGAAMVRQVRRESGGGGPRGEAATGWVQWNHCRRHRDDRVIHVAVTSYATGPLPLL